MIYVLVFLLIAILVFPSIWVKYTIKKYNKNQSYIPGSGAQLVKHLANRFELNDLQVEKCAEGEDHYSPREQMIRLSPSIYDGHSISAVAIAAHEFGHALQYNRKENITRLRERWTPLAMFIEKISIGLIGITPILVAIFKVPQLGIISLIAAIASLILSILIQLIVLPMEWDASFNKALPIIEQGNYLEEADIYKARKILKAAACTYLAGTLSSLLSVWRWFRILRS